MSDPSRTVDHMFDLTGLAVVDPHADDAALIAQISELEQVKSAAAAGQARAAAALDELRRRDEADSGVLAAERGRGVASEIALARRDSPARGARHLRVAKTLVHDMPHTLAALETGTLSEWRATLIVEEAGDLSTEDRRILDAELCADVTTLEGMGDKRITPPPSRSHTGSTTGRRRSAPPRPLPTAGASTRPGRHDLRDRAAAGRPRGERVCGAEPGRHTIVDHRSRGAVMADTLVERVTGRPAGTPEPVAVNLVISDETLLGGDNTSAVVEGYGPIPASVARSLSMRRSPTSGLGPPFAGLSAPKVRGFTGDGITITMLPARAGQVHRVA